MDGVTLRGGVEPRVRLLAAAGAVEVDALAGVRGRVFDVGQPVEGPFPAHVSVAEDLRLERVALVVAQVEADAGSDGGRIPALVAGRSAQRRRLEAGHDALALQ